MLLQRELFYCDRLLRQLTVGTMPHAQVLRAIKLLGTVVAPAVRRAVATDAKGYTLEGSVQS